MIRHGLVIVSAVLLNACVAREDHLRQISSGHVGCAPQKIEISEDTGGSWVAACGGRAFRCSTSGGGVIRHPTYGGYGGSSYGGGYSKVEGTAHCAEDKEATEATSAPSAISSEPMNLHIGRAIFTVPGGFRADPYKGHKTYHPSSGWDRFAYLDIESHDGTSSDYAAAKYADRTVKSVKMNGKVKVLAVHSQIHFKTPLNVATLVEVVDGEAYSLTCADAEGDDESVSPFCKGVFKSLRVGTGE